MKKHTKLLLIPAICQAFLVPYALAAKTFDPNDPDAKKGKKRDQPALPGGGQNNTKKNNNGGGFQPQPKQPKQQPSNDFQPPKKKPSQPDSPVVKKPSNRTETPPKNHSGSQDKPGNNGGGSNELKNKHPEKIDKGDNKPMPLPGKRPGTGEADKKNPSGKNDKPGKNDIADKNDKPVSKPMPLPGKRPNMPPGLADKKPEHPENGNRPGNKDLPNGMPGKRPNIPQGQVDKNGNKNTKNNIVRVQPVVRPGQNTKQVKHADIQQNNKNTWWNSGNRINSGNTNITVNNVTKVNNNFSRSVNWNTNRHAWGYNPWWNRPATRPWYGSSWNCGWNRGYYHNHYTYHNYGGYRPPGYHNEVAEAIGWGLVGWSLGALVYDIGYHNYYNPYPVRAIPVSYGEITYTQPITQIAIKTAPADDEAVAKNTAKSESLIGESQTAFKQKNYLVALELADKAIAETPGDGALHEYRALVLFALGKYGDAAGVLNPVLASGPGWDWSTMIALYDAQETYTDQLQKLEAYTEQKPDAADSHFLLGYHYMVCGHLDLATPQFDAAVKLMPNDSVSKELAELTRASAKPGEETAPDNTAAPEDAPAPQPVELEKLAGTWVSTREGGGSITLSFGNDGTFKWSFVKEGKTSEFAGEYSINDNGLLVLDSKESQMVASVDLPQEKEMKFVLAGGPPADPGLSFVKN